MSRVNELVARGGGGAAQVLDNEALRLARASSCSVVPRASCLVVCSISAKAAANSVSVRIRLAQRQVVCVCVCATVCACVRCASVCACVFLTAKTTNTHFKNFSCKFEIGNRAKRSQSEVNYKLTG